MSSTPRRQLRHILQPRLDSIVEQWQRAIAQTSYASLDSAQVRECLVAWTKEILTLLTAESFERSKAAAIGQALAELHYLQPEALSLTLDILSRELVADLSTEQVVALHPRLSLLLIELAFGFYREARKTILYEQEQVRAALVGELARTATALQESRDHLELRVQQRTRELELLNQDLQNEALERERIARALGESEERYRTVSELVSDYVYSIRISPDGVPVLEWATEAYSRITGYSSEDFGNGGDWERFIHPEDRDIAARHFQRHVAGRAGVSEYRIVTRSGQVRWMRDHSQPVWDEAQGRVTRVYGGVQDITERKRIEELKDNLIRDVSHELRTPLAKVRMGLDLLNEALAEEEIDRTRVSKIGGVVRGNVQRLLQTVEVMLDLSSLESGQIKYMQEEVDPRKLAEDAIVDMVPLAAVKGLELVADLPEDLSPVTGDRDKLFRVLVNLIDNAIKFTQEGTITLSAQASQNELTFAVSDPGLGILSENLERIFERFFQEKTRFHGVGVGLAICRAIVEAHGGRIWAESPGRGLGSTIRFTLPIALV